MRKKSCLFSKENDIGQVVFSPLAQGVLTGKYKPGENLPSESRAGKGQTNYSIKSYLNDQVLEQVSKLEDIASELGVKLSQLAVAWILRQPGISSAIVGASRPSQIEENVQATKIELTDDTFTTYNLS